MTKLPTTSPKQVVKVLLRAGFETQHQVGTHLGFFDPRTRRRILVPLHAGDLHRELLKRILNQAKLTEDQFLRLI